ncbi:S-layer homology domain-containing protein [Dapis sp. BLCC M126]|uniref:S-layer homology domain-containing protein n=1 Tax=Dapis sp. BLCC M126 TaxID=3400189 RepID=UPI003CF420AE
MTNTPTKPPSRPRPVERDEWIAIFVALATFGSIFFWATTRENNGFNLLSKPMVSTPLPQTVDSPNIAAEESIFSLGIPQLKTPTGESESNIDRASLTSEELGISLAALTPITNTVEELEPNIKGLDEIKTNTDTTPKLTKPSKTTNQKTAPEVAKNLAALGIGKMLSESPSAISPAVVDSPIVTETLPVAPPIPSPTTESPQATETSLPPKAETSESPQATETSPPQKVETSESPQVTETSLPPKVETPESPQATETSPPPKVETPEIPLVSTEVPSPDTSPTSTIKFSDVPNSFWASNFIQPLAERNLIAEIDNDKFEPNKPITRAEFASHIPKVFEEKSTRKSVNYEDVKADSTAQSEIQTATKSGFLTGYPGNVFRPEQEVSRLEVLISLASGLNLEIPSNPDEVLSIYKDNEEIPDWAKGKIAATTVAGLVVNHPDVTTLNLNKPATRAEVSAIFYQALVKSGKVEQVSSEYIVSPKKEN